MEDSPVFRLIELDSNKREKTTQNQHDDKTATPQGARADRPDLETVDLGDSGRLGEDAESAVVHPARDRRADPNRRAEITEVKAERFACEVRRRQNRRRRYHRRRT